MYVHMLAQRDLMLRFNNQGVPAWEDRMMRVGWPLAVRYAQRDLGIRPGVEVEDEASVFRELDFVAGLLADGGKHLCGDRFSAADLTFAALSASVMVPPVYGVSLPQPRLLTSPPQRSSSGSAPIPPEATRLRCSRNTAARSSRASLTRGVPRSAG